MSEIGQEGVNVILAAFNVYCPKGGSNTGGSNPPTDSNPGNTGNHGSNSGNNAGSGAEQDRINKST